MSSNLTSTQIAAFDVFANDVSEFFERHSEQNRVNTEVFNIVREGIFRPSALGRVMRTSKFFEEHGRTKEMFQLRTPEGVLCFNPDGSKQMSSRRAVMYTTEAFLEMRRNRTGLKTPEQFYYIPWTALPEVTRRKLQQYFPYPDENKPSFEPTSVGILLRKGNKPKKGEKRYSWFPPQFLIRGKYDGEAVVITGAVVLQKPYVGPLSDICDCDNPLEAGEEPQEVSGQESLAASGLVSQIDMML